MKKIILVIWILCAAGISTVEAQTQANIYASGLSATAADMYGNVDFTYTLNADASTMSITVDYGSDVTDVFPVTETANLSKGTHTITKRLTAAKTTVGESYGWKIDVTGVAGKTNTTGAPVQVSDNSVQMRFFGPRGVAVDNSFESPFFGRIYVSETSGGTTTASGARTVQRGVYILDAAWSDVTNQGNTSYAGGETWQGFSTSSVTSTISGGLQSPTHSPYRITVAPSGDVYISDGSESHAGVWKMNPANPSANFTGVFNAGVVSDVHGRITDCIVLSSGDETKLYTFDIDFGGNILRYDIGNLSSTWTSAPSAVVYDDLNTGWTNTSTVTPQNNLQQNGTGNSIATDGRGGWWISQYRSSNSETIPSLIHTNSSGVVDYNSYVQSTTLVPGSYQGGMSVSPDGSLLAMGTDNQGGNIRVYSVNYEGGISLTQIGLISNGSAQVNQDVAFDIANNVYVVSYQTENLSVWALPKSTASDNAFTTPAPASQSISVSKEIQVGSLAGATIYINPGHGGTDSDDRPMWIVNYPAGNVNSFYESKSNLAKGLALRDMLQAVGATVYMSRTTNTSADDRTLSNIVAEANANNADAFLSIHSNGFQKTSNYSLMLYAGITDGDTHTYPTSTPYSAESKSLATYIGNNIYANALTVWLSSLQVHGDKTHGRLYQSPSWDDGYGVLRGIAMPGLISEGEFHDYPPETHRLMNADYCKLEAISFLRAFYSFFNEPPANTGTIAGWVKSERELVDVLGESNFTYFSGSDDQYLPLNGATVKLLNSEGTEEIASYTTDNWYNGVFAFYNLPAGNYQLRISCANYSTKTVSVVVTAGGVTYSKNKLGPEIIGTYYIPTIPSGEKGWTSLSAAFADINTYGIAGDVNLLINDNITETQNVGLVNTTDYTITIRPDADVDRTITFSDPADELTGPSGSFLIGTSNMLWTGMTATKNITIDGYAEGGNTRRLKITTNGVGAQIPLVILNGSDNIIVKNSIIEHKPTSGSYAVYMRCNPSYGQNSMPKNITIENNEIINNGHNSAQTVALYADAAPAAMSTGVVIKNNILRARTRGVFMSYVNGIEIIGNEFHVVQIGTGTTSGAIMPYLSVSGDITVADNKFIDLQTAAGATSADNGVHGIIMYSGTASGNWNIYNNYFTGFSKLTTAAADGSYLTGICAMQGTPSLNIRHNTFVLNAQANKASEYYNAIRITAAGSTVGAIENNLFVSEESNYANSFIANNATANNNVFVIAPANTQAVVSTGTISGTNVETSAVTFASATDLAISGSSVGDFHLAVPYLDAVPNDIAGKARGGNTYEGDETAASRYTYAGAYEGDLPFKADTAFWAASAESRAWTEASNWTYQPAAAGAIGENTNIVIATTSNELFPEISEATSLKSLTFKLSNAGDLSGTRGAGLSITDGGTLSVSGKVTVDYLVADNKWYTVGFPFAVDSVNSLLDDYINSDGWNPLIPHGAANYSDFWMQDYAYRNPPFQEYSGSIAAGNGYMVQFPNWFDGSEIRFQSADGAIRNFTNAFSSSAIEAEYKMYANPTFDVLTFIQPAENTNNGIYYYKGEYSVEDSYAGVSFKRVTYGEQVTFEPFEPFIAIKWTTGSGELRAYFGRGEATALPDLNAKGGDADDPVVSEEYYNMQGVRIAQPHGAYIVKQTLKSGKIKTLKRVKS